MPDSAAPLYTAGRRVARWVGGGGEARQGLRTSGDECRYVRGWEVRFLFRLDGWKDRMLSDAQPTHPYSVFAPLSCLHSTTRRVDLPYAGGRQANVFSSRNFSPKRGRSGTRATRSNIAPRRQSVGGVHILKSITEVLF